MHVSVQEMLLFRVSFAILLAGCTDVPSLSVTTTPPDGTPLETISSLALPRDVWASDAVGLPGCDVVLSSHRSGQIVRVTDRGDAVASWSPSRRRIGTRLDVAGATVLVSSERPENLGLLRLASMAYEDWLVPHHPWGGHLVGSAAAIDSGRAAVAPVAGSVEREQPDPWRASPLLTVVRPDGLSLMHIDSVRHHPGRFLSWRRSRVAVGASADAILVVDLSTGRMRAYSIETGALLEEGAMVRYFESPEPREEVWTPEWIQLGADLRTFYDVPHVSTVGFRADGLIYAVRVYEAEWRAGPNAYTPTQGAWTTTARGLEVYEVNGAPLGHFQLPGAVRAPSWISVDGLGRVFMPDTLGGVHIVKDPLLPDGPCVTDAGEHHHLGSHVIH